MPIIETKGAASSQGFGQFASTGEAVYIESVFSTWLYTGNGSTQTITNGIDLATKGGLVWLKYRSGSTGSTYHHVYDSARGKSGFSSYNYLYPNDTSAQGSGSSGPTSFNSDGFSLNSYLNASTIPYVSWTFAKQAKFFDVLTYTGTGSPQSISHSLGSAPGLIIVKGVSGDFSTGNWAVYHRSLTATTAIQLNNSNQAFTTSSYWNNTEPTSTHFTVGTASQTGAPNTTYVAYLFAHNAGGFGLTGTDNVVSCGSYTGNGSTTGPSITLGYEPQWVMIKNASYTSSYWMIYDNMRGWPVGSNPNLLYPNVSDAEANASWAKVDLLPTGFQIRTTDSWLNQSGDTYIYIAIRRGPMKTPTSGTSVFTPDSSSAAGNQTITAGFPTDMLWQKSKPNVGDWYAGTRLQGNAIWLNQNSTAAETNFSSIDPTVLVFTNAQNSVSTNLTGSPISYALRRAPGFFDVVCYTGTGVNRTVNHNLGVVPELMIVKRRDAAATWPVYYGDATRVLFLEGTDAGGASGAWNNTAPTSTVFSISGSASALNASGGTYVAYLFASCPGVSKVGTYTGTGTLQTINCGFTGGARFVLIKRISSTGNWIVWDTARGMVAGTDPALFINTTDAQTNFNSVYSTAGGFQILASPNEPVNINGSTYIYLAIA